MVTLSVILLTISFAFLLIIFFKKKILLASNYMVYVFFSGLYSIFPILTFYGIEPKIWFVHYSLNESELLVAIQIFIISLCNAIFAFVFYFNYKNFYNKQDMSLVHDNFIGQNLLFAGYLIICLVLLYFGYTYSYTSGRGEMVHSTISNAKVILASIYIFYMVRYGVGYQLFIMFFGFLGLLFVEQSRWYFASILVGTFFYLQNKGKLTNKKMVLIGGVFLVILSYIGLTRSNVEITDFIILLNPFYIEGDYGSYMILQTYDLIFRGLISFYTLFSDYFVDPFLYLIPRFLFINFDTNKDSIGIFQYFVSSHQQYLDEVYAPVGGFHYIAQASSAFPFFGPLIITYFFARITIGIESAIYKSKFHELTYYLYSAGFAFVFIKTMFQQTIKYYLTLAIPAYFLFFIFEGLKRHSNAKKIYS